MDINPLTEEELVRRLRTAGVSRGILKKVKEWKRRGMTGAEREIYWKYRHKPNIVPRYIVEASLAVGKKPRTVYQRMRGYGHAFCYDMDLALRAPVRRRAVMKACTDPWTGDLVSWNEMARRGEMDSGTFHNRMKRNGGDVAAAVTKPIKEANRMYPCTGPNGVATEMSRASFARLYRIPYDYLYDWMRRRGMTMDEVRSMWEIKREMWERERWARMTDEDKAALMAIERRIAARGG
jgi:hypothetical protein